MSKREKRQRANERERQKGTSGQCACIAVSFHSGVETKKARRYRGYAMRNRDRGVL